MSVSASGPLPASGLIVSNHLSYLDILFYASLMPCIFVSKSEVLSWPLFGILARCGGTIFVERSRAHGVDEPARRIAAALTLGIPVVLFPEGTSTDGRTVLPFRIRVVATGGRHSNARFFPLPLPICSRTASKQIFATTERSLFCHISSMRLRGSESKRRLSSRDEARIYSDRKIAAKAAWQDVVSLRATVAAAFKTQ